MEDVEKGNTRTDEKMVVVKDTELNKLNEEIDKLYSRATEMRG